jgi:hypothetical protein
MTNDCRLVVIKVSVRSTNEFYDMIKVLKEDNRNTEYIFGA